MKKIIISFVLLVCISVLQVNAQISLIPKFGLTFSNIAFSDEIEDALTDGVGVKKSTMGFLGGLALNIGVSEGFSVQPELLFIQKGTMFEASGLEFTLQTNYIELPLLAKYSFGTDKFKGFVNAGPSIGLGIGGQAKTDTPFGTLEEDLTFGDDEDDYFDNAMDFGLQFGAGGMFKIGPGSILLEARYGLGLSNLFQEDGIDKDLLKSKNNVFSIQLGYAIPIGGN